MLTYKINKDIYMRRFREFVICGRSVLVEVIPFVKTVVCQSVWLAVGVIGRIVSIIIIF